LSTSIILAPSSLAYRDQLGLILILQKTDLPELLATLFFELKGSESLAEKLNGLWVEERFLAVVRRSSFDGFLSYL
jgi:hypothetical protein